MTRDDAMAGASGFDAWHAGAAYERYMGRWSRLMAGEFLDWLGAPAAADWLDLGCGTGALTGTILERCAPASVTAIDPSEDFTSYAAAQLADPRAGFRVGSAQQIPAGKDAFDVAVSGLVLNFVPDPVAALQEMRRVLKPGGLLAFYVWDYPGGGLGFLDVFWKAAAEVDPRAAELDEGLRFPHCTQAGLRALCDAAGLRVEVTRIGATTRFADFDALWEPFTLGAGPAPGYLARQPDPVQRDIRAAMRARLGRDGAQSLPAHAWAVRTVANG